MQAICSLMDLQSPPFYHCVSRNFHRSYLGDEEYQQRCEWLEQHLQNLSSVFAIDISTYTVLANHYHVIVYCNNETLNGLSIDEVIKRWHRLFDGTPLSRRHLSGFTLSSAEKQSLLSTVELWKRRLLDVSWYMRILNEAILQDTGKHESNDFVYAPVSVYPQYG